MYTATLFRSLRPCGEAQCYELRDQISLASGIKCPRASWPATILTPGHGTQTRCAKQRDSAKIFHCFKLGNKASSRFVPRPHGLQACTPWTPRSFLGAPGAAVVQTRKHAQLPDVNEGQSCNLSKKNKNEGDKSKCWKFFCGHFALTQFCLRSCSWKALSLLSSALFSHAVCRQYKNFDITQTSKIRISSVFGRTAWFQTRDNVSISAFAAPRRVFSSGPVLPLSQEKPK